VVNVAGNHDTINLNHGDLSRVWGRRGELHYALDTGGPGSVRLVILHTVERKDTDVRIEPGQLAWLREELASGTSPVVVLMHHSASEQDLSDSRWFAGAAHIALVRERAELRGILRESGRVRAVFNGHLHRNHLDVIDGIPYVTLQSLIENLDDDAPGRAAASFAVVRVEPGRMVVRVCGADPARYQFEFPG
jgi:3',5'-cyclic-AMP phosphodiesterase